MALAMRMNVGGVKVEIHDDYMVKKEEREELLRRIALIYIRSMERMSPEEQEQAVQRARDFEEECRRNPPEILPL